MLNYQTVIVAALSLAVIVAGVTVIDWQRYHETDVATVSEGFAGYDLTLWGDLKGYDQAGASLTTIGGMPWYVGATYNVSKNGEEIGQLMIDLHQRDRYAVGKTAVRTRPTSLTETAALDNKTYLVFDPENETSFDRVAYTYYDGAMLRFDSEVGREKTLKEIRLLREDLVESVDDVDDSVWSVGPTAYSLLGLGDAPERFGGETIPSERYTQLQLVPNEPALE